MATASVFRPNNVGNFGEQDYLDVAAKLGLQRDECQWGVNLETVDGVKGCRLIATPRFPAAPATDTKGK